MLGDSPAHSLVCPNCSKPLGLGLYGYLKQHSPELCMSCGTWLRLDSRSKWLGFLAMLGIAFAFLLPAWIFDVSDHPYIPLVLSIVLAFVSISAGAFVIRKNARWNVVE